MSLEYFPWEGAQHFWSLAHCLLSLSRQPDLFLFADEPSLSRGGVVAPDRFKLWKDGPNFDTDLPQNVMAVEGKTAYLACRVFDRDNKTVSEGILFLL